MSDSECDIEMPCLRRPGRKTELKINWKGQILTVVKILQQRPIAIVVLVEWKGNKQRVVKIVSDAVEINTTSDIYLLA